jgi:hypothetical protein
MGPQQHAQQHARMASRDARRWSCGTRVRTGCDGGAVGLKNLARALSAHRKPASERNAAAKASAVCHTGTRSPAGRRGAQVDAHRARAQRIVARVGDGVPVISTAIAGLDCADRSSFSQIACRKWKLKRGWCEDGAGMDSRERRAMHG